jgi:hypothetical protein
MFVIVGSGTREGEGMPETGTSYSVEPIASGPGCSGNVGIGLREENMLRVTDKWSHDLDEQSRKRYELGELSAQGKRGETPKEQPRPRYDQDHSEIFWGVL